MVETNHLVHEVIPMGLGQSTNTPLLLRLSETPIPSIFQHLHPFQSPNNRQPLQPLHSDLPSTNQKYHQHVISKSRTLPPDEDGENLTFQPCVERHLVALETPSDPQGSPSKLPPEHKVMKLEGLTNK